MNSKTNAEIFGPNLLNIIDGMGVFQRRGKELLAKNGITDIDSEKWYPLDPMLSVLYELGPATCSQVGRAVPNNSLFPPDIDTFEKALMGINIAYAMNHRNGNIGNYTVHKETDSDFKVICNNPYPQQFNAGLIRGLAAKFDTLIRVVEDDKTGGGTFSVHIV